MSCNKLLGFALLVTLGLSTVHAEEAPFRVLYSNDTTNITTCKWPGRVPGKVGKKSLNPSIDETAGIGVDVHMLQPGTTWLPWWKSKKYSMQDHYKWFESKYGIKPDANEFNRYILGGGDLVAEFIARCRRDKIIPFISLRMNDGHFLETWDDTPPKGAAPAHCLSKFYVENCPQYIIGYEEGGKPVNFRNWDERVQNWAIEEVRQYKLDMIREVCENYDFPGLELDFMRHGSLFNTKQNSFFERKVIMDRFIYEVRKILNQTAKKGEHRYLCVRIPATLTDHNRLGIDVKNWVRAGVDMFDLSASYFTCQQNDFAKIASMVPDASCYLEMTQCTYTGKILCPGYDGFSFRRTTPIQYYTAAHLAYERGAAGVSLFNFAYYRNHGGEKRGPFNEPPFEIIKRLRDPKWLARQPQHYILAAMWDAANHTAPQIKKNGDIFDKDGQYKTYAFDMAPPARGWSKDGKLRIQSYEPFGDSVWTAKINGTELVATEDVSEPYPNPYTPLLGDASVHKGWIVPSKILKAGINKVRVTRVKGSSSDKICFIDIAVE